MSMFKGGGGYLKGVTATIIGITFESKEWEPKKKGADPYSTLSAKLTFRLEGATADAHTFLKAGFFYPENQTISEDGTTLGSDRNGAIIARDTEFEKLISSIEAIDPSLFEGADGRNFSMVNGLRVTFDRILDEKGTKEFGKRKGKTKDGKEAEFNRDFLVVSAVHGKVEVKASAPASSAASAKTQKAAPAKAQKAAAAPKASAPAAPAAPAATGTELADTALLAIVTEAGGSVERKVMGSKATRYRLKANLDEATGEALRTTLMSDDYINGAVVRGLIDLDGGTITKA